MTQFETEICELSGNNLQFASCDESNDLENPSLTITSDKSKLALHAAANLLKSGQTIAVPTETVYGLAADALNERAVTKIFDAKNRPSDNPLIVHISSLAMARDLCCANQQLPPVYYPLISKFWPGPLTILVPRSSKICDAVIGPQCDKIQTIGLRMPSHPIMRALIAVYGRPLAAPSANLSGKPSSTNARHVYEDFKGRIPMILADVDGDQMCEVGIESTVIDAMRYPPVILRPGAITLEMVRDVCGFEETLMYTGDRPIEAGSDNNQEVPTTPGMKYRHYSPVKAKVVLICSNHIDVNVNDDDYDDDDERLSLEIVKQINRLGREASTIGIIRNRNIQFLPATTADAGTDEVQIGMSQFAITKPVRNVKLVDFHIRKDDADNKLFGKHLFEGLRYLDEEQPVDVILIHGVPERGIGAALMNRIRKAASEIIQYSIL